MRLKFVTIWRYCPRTLTLILLLVVAALLALANLSCDPLTEPKMRMGYGWPLIWHWHAIVGATVAGPIVGWDYSAPRLAADLAIWLVMLAAAGTACEKLLRRYWPRPRWRLRTMLAAVALLAASCAWFAAARDRARTHDAIIALAEKCGGDVYFERWGPGWLDLVGADRFRRRIIGARLCPADADDKADFDRLLQLLDLRRLRILSIDFGSSATGTQRDHENRDLSELLSVVGELTQLEELELGDISMADVPLERLAALTNLRFLGLSIYAKDEPCPLSRLPALPRLEALVLSVRTIGDQDLRRLVAHPRLKSLDLSDTRITHAGLAELASLDSLEELAIFGEFVSTATLESLRAIKRLNRLHLVSSAASYVGDLAMLELDDGGLLHVFARDADDLRLALEALRRSHPEIVIDADHRALDWRSKHLDALPNRGVPAALRRYMTFPFLPQWITDAWADMNGT